ncbi:hypothetical protein [Variovorax sp. KK3]|uniref:hypothetical protein n=1 Tax=Variovorax sp. KK3 TaxID=1855728 RepID=UPI00097C05A4|nr:hypothetical protein [Variovorax sp. KK3]
MQSAPSVSYPVGRSRIANRLFLLLWIAGAGGVIAAVVRLDADWRIGPLLFAVVGAGAAWYGSALRRPPAAMLEFDGAEWSISHPFIGPAPKLRVALDFQSSLLAHFDSARGARLWLWLDRDAMPERWQALRRAVYSQSAPGLTPVASRSSGSVGTQHSLS